MSRPLEVTRNTKKTSPTHTKYYTERAQSRSLFWEDEDKYLTVCTNRWVPTAEYASPAGKDVAQCNLTFSLWHCNNIGLIIISQLPRGGLWNKVESCSIYIVITTTDAVPDRHEAVIPLEFSVSGPEDWIHLNFKVYFWGKENTLAALEIHVVLSQPLKTCTLC